VSVRAAAIGVLLPCCAVAAPALQPLNPAQPADIPTAGTEPDPHSGPVTRPSTAGRVVRAFPFDRRLPTPIPIEDWYRGQSSVERERPGFPVWNAATLDHDTFHKGGGSLRLPVQGGSASVMLRAGVLPVFGNADYLVTASVRTDGLEHAGAFLEAWLTDEAGNEIPDSRARSQPTRTNATWQPLGVEVLGDDPRAAFLRIELSVLQPKALAPATEPDGPFRVWQEDYDAAAWFDEVEVRQLPRVEIRPLANSQQHAILARSEQPPTLEVLVRDLAGDDLDVELTVTDAWGRTADTTTAPMTSGRYSRHWTPDLQAHGWYRASVRVRAHDGIVVGGGRADFAWLDSHAGVEQRFADAGTDTITVSTANTERFGLEFVGLNTPTLHALEHVTTASGVGWISVPVWGGPDTNTADLFANHNAGDAIERLLNRGIDIGLRFDDAPAELSKSLGGGPLEAVQVFDEPEELWIGWTDPTLDRFGQRIRRWGVGTPDRAAPGRPAAPELKRFRDAIARLVPAPVVTLPWRDDLGLPAALSRGATRLRLRLDATHDHRALAELAGAWGTLVRDWHTANTTPDPTRSWRGPELELVLHPLNDATYAPGPAAADTVKRAIETLSAFRHAGATTAADRKAGRIGKPVVVTLADPVRESGGRRPRAHATPALAAWAAMTDRLRARAVAEELDLAPGLRCFVLDDLGPEANGAIVLWREDAHTETIDLTAFLGDHHVTAVDLFGNRTPVTTSSPGPKQRPEHHVTVTGHPVFIEGIDTGLLRLLASVRIDPGLVHATPRVHPHDLVFDNPTDQPIRARAYILEPGGYTHGIQNVDRRWNITPRVFEFSVPPRATTRVPLQIEFSPGTPAGEIPLVLDLDLEHLPGHGLIRVRRTIEIGVEEIDLTVYPRYASQESPDDAFVVAEVTNRGTRPLNLEIVSAVPGFPRAKATINALQPGETILRTFALPGARGTLPHGSTGAVSITEPGASEGFRLIKAITFD